MRSHVVILSWVLNVSFTQWWKWQRLTGETEWGLFYIFKPQMQKMSLYLCIKCGWNSLHFEVDPYLKFNPSAAFPPYPALAI